MKKAKIAELKNRLSYYLRFVRAGQPVLVYDRDRIIARIEPVTDAESVPAEDWVAELVRVGVLRAPRAKLPVDWLKQRKAVKADLVSALLEERDTGR